MTNFRHVKPAVSRFIVSASSLPRSVVYRITVIHVHCLTSSRLHQPSSRYPRFFPTLGSPGSYPSDHSDLLTKNLPPFCLILSRILVGALGKVGIFDLRYLQSDGNYCMALVTIDGAGFNGEGAPSPLPRIPCLAELSSSIKKTDILTGNCDKNNNKRSNPGSDPWRTDFGGLCKGQG